jgi:hypothetical protein
MPTWVNKPFPFDELNENTRTEVPAIVQALFKLLNITFSSVKSM